MSRVAITKWTRMPEGSKQAAKWWCVVDCPGCGSAGTLSRAVHTVLENGDVVPSFVCPHPPCTFHEWVYLAGWSAALGSEDPV